MTTQDNTKKFRQFSVLALAVFALALSQPASADDRPDMIADIAFVTASLDSVKAGTSRAVVLDGLRDIASRDGVDPPLGVMALRAMVHLAKDDASIQDYLLRVIRSAANDTVVNEACVLITYVADQDGRKALLHEVVQAWKAERLHPAMESLATLGDQSFANWIDRTVKSLKADDPRDPFLNSLAERIRLQESPSNLVAYLKSGSKTLDRGWVVRQAVRLGVKRSEIRDAALASLGHSEKSDTLSSNLELLLACEECRIFTDEDASKISLVRDTKNLKILVPHEGHSPMWATLPQALRARFYRIDAAKSES